MFSKIPTTTLLYITGILVSVSATIHADNLNTSGIVCRNYIAAEVKDIDYTASGVTNIAVDYRYIICPIPRSPINSGPVAEFFVDGFNTGNTSTTCTVMIHDYSGNFKTSTTFTEAGDTPGRAWDHAVFFNTTNQLTKYDYVSMYCSIPGNKQSVIYGITAVQP